MKIKFRPYLLSLIISFGMSCVMSLVGVFRTIGFVQGWVSQWLNSLLLMFPVAFACALIFSPLAANLSNKISWED